MAVHLARRSRRSQDARGLVDGAAAGREARDAVGAVHLQMGDRRADRCGYCSGAAVELDDVADRLAPDHDRQLRSRARADGGPRPNGATESSLAWRCMRCASSPIHFYPHARTVAALSSGTQDRWTDARAGARPLRHRGHRADGDPAAGPDHRRGFAADGGAAVAVRLALCARHHDHRRDLHVLHLHRDRMADRAPQDERFRHRREHQGDRLASELRDGEIFQRRGTRSRALRPFDGALRTGQREDLHLAGSPQYRAGGHFHLRPHRDHADVRAGRAAAEKTRSAISSWSTP